MKKKKKLIWVIAIIAVVLTTFIGVKTFIEKTIAKTQMEEKKTEYIDANAYYDKNSDVLDSIDVRESVSIQTESQIIAVLNERGFGNNPIYTDYSIDGAYIGGKEISESNEKHPSYQTTYISLNNELWTIIVMNGCIMANPVSFNMESGLGVQLIVAESEKIMCYDSQTNMFYETIPKESALIVIVQDKINTETLDKLTVEVIKDYEQN